MKIIIILSLLITTFFSCSKDSNEDETIKNTTPRELIGKWKLVGYYDDIDNDPVTGTNYHLVQDGGITIFNVNGNIEMPAYSLNPVGTYSVSIDSIITVNFNTNYSWNPNSTETNKIHLLNNQFLELTCNQANVMCDTYRYEKVNP